MIKAILFDLDGTLVDSNDLHILAWEQVFRDEGVAVDRRRIHDQIGKGADHFVPALIPGADATTAERLGEAHGALFKAHYLETVSPFPGASDLLRRVRDSGRQVVFASSASGAELDHYLDLLAARDIVVATTTADDVGSTKPAPDIFAMALGKLDGVDAREALVVGDTPYDIAAAAKCGIAGVAVRSGGFPDAALSAAVAIYNDVAALLTDFDTSPLNR
ncbi:HAD family hydrolase [Sphingomonas sp.]|jgi:membrane protein|uniref:HAD family hydrolase n=1 Tax=Sphingomonas sp. TaxID=28214 RepID=UPI002D7F5B64|nr:HAD family hydrolase [Sphingomonas sp.]HEU0045265.1 HAD family hydrolase [Sphingomonas sp.]